MAGKPAGREALGLLVPGQSETVEFLHRFADPGPQVVTARLERAESKLRHLDEEISREREELSRIVRDARRRGAEPGWFR